MTEIEWSETTYHELHERPSTTLHAKVEGIKVHIGEYSWCFRCKIDGMRIQVSGGSSFDMREATQSKAKREVVEAVKKMKALGAKPDYQYDGAT